MRPTLLALALLAIPVADAVASPPPPIAVNGGCYDTDYYDTVVYVRGVATVCMYNAPIENGVG